MTSAEVFFRNSAQQRIAQRFRAAIEPGDVIATRILPPETPDLIVLPASAVKKTPRLESQPNNLTQLFLLPTPETEPTPEPIAPSIPSMPEDLTGTIASRFLANLEKPKNKKDQADLENNPIWYVLIDLAQAALEPLS